MFVKTFAPRSRIGVTRPRNLRHVVDVRISSKEAAVLSQLADARVLPVATIEDAALVEPLCRALVAGGLPCIEIAFRSDAAVEALQRASRIEGCLAGAGTVLQPAQAEAALAAGASFAVAPGTNDDVVAACGKLDLLFFPGVATPSEIEHARQLGLRTLKVFPAAQLGGPAFLRAVTPTYPDVQFIPTGGVGPENLPDYLAVPSVLAVGGSWLVRPELLRERRFDEVERLAREVVELVR
jgi:2-dehydro-3-deoxyphosphogluconate aldolase/(4S)-4-hydroxy-2-oxoglutarate aldolase